MLRFEITNEKVSKVEDDKNEPASGESRIWSNFRERDYAADIASQANALKDGDTYVVEDRGSNVTPRYGVIRLFKVGDEVSYTFNGDTYPDGTIVSISKTLILIKTSTGRSYFRRGESGSWVRDRTWTLISGHHSERNPSF